MQWKCGVLTGPPEPLHCRLSWPHWLPSPRLPVSLHLPAESQAVPHTSSCLPDIRHGFQHDPVLCHPQKPRHGLESSFVP